MFALLVEASLPVVRVDRGGSICDDVTGMQAGAVLTVPIGVGATTPASGIGNSLWAKAEGPPGREQAPAPAARPSASHKSGRRRAADGSRDPELIASPSRRHRKGPRPTSDRRA